MLQGGGLGDDEMFAMAVALDALTAFAETGDNPGTFEASETGDATGTFEASETGGDELLAMTGTNAVRNAVSVAVNNVAVNVGIRNVTHGIPQMPIHGAPPRVETPRSYTITAGPSRPFGTQ